MTELDNPGTFSIGGKFEIFRSYQRQYRVAADVLFEAGLHIAALYSLRHSFELLLKQQLGIANRIRVLRTALGGAQVEFEHIQVESSEHNLPNLLETLEAALPDSIQPPESFVEMVSWMVEIEAKDPTRTRYSRTTKGEPSFPKEIEVDWARGSDLLRRCEESTFHAVAVLGSYTETFGDRLYAAYEDSRGGVDADHGIYSVQLLQWSSQVGWQEVTALPRKQKKWKDCCFALAVPVDYQLKFWTVKLPASEAGFTLPAYGDGLTPDWSTLLSRLKDPK